MIDGFTVIWSFRNRFEVFKKSIESADRTTPKNVNFCLIDAASNEDTIKNLRIFCNSFSDRKIRICESAYRSGLSEAWNLGMMLSETRYVIFSSSDINFLNPGWFTSLENSARSGREYILLENHSVFCIDKKSIPRLGWFDEEFIAGPHFDVDYMIRASENGINFFILGNPNLYTHGEENEEEISKERIKEDFEDENRLPMNDLHNENYFKEKWRSSWEGWANRIHPPTHISQVIRSKPEIDPHPIYTKKYS